MKNQVPSIQKPIDTLTPKSKATKVATNINEKL
jgi:hypothetical protein